MTIEERFWKKVIKTKGCWEWIGAKFPGGYGNFRGNCAHRFAYSLQNGEIPKGLVACHKCDNKICVNPSHIFIGTHADNVLDKVKKGRHPRGSRTYNSKLNEKCVREIRKKYIPRKYSMYRLAREYGVHVMTICDVLSGKKWAHVTDHS